MKSQNKPLKKDALPQSDTNNLRDLEGEKRVAEALEKFKQDNQGKTWDDLAREQDAHLGKPSE